MKLKTYLLTLAISISTASAHGIWLTPHYGELGIVYGMGAKDDAYSPKKVKSVKAYDKNFNLAKVDVTKHEKHVNVIPSNNTSIVTSFLDNGYWKKGKVKKWTSIDKKDIKSASNISTSLKYNISILNTYKKEMKLFKDLPVQIIPHTNPAKLKQGDKVKVTVYINEKPAKGVSITADYVNDFRNKIKTDKNGEAILTVRNSGLNVFAALVSNKTPKDEFAHLQRTVSTLSFKLLKK